MRTEPTDGVAIARLMGLAIFGERVAARTYACMAQIRPDHADILRRFAEMEAGHGRAFQGVCADNDVVPDREFADGELGYLIEQVDEHFEAGRFDALAILQGLIVESLAIATYDPFLAISDRFRGARTVFAQALADEHYHVDWIVRYLRLRYFDDTDGLLRLATEVNARGVDCVGGTMMNIARYLDDIGLSGADCAGTMMDGYSELLERAGVEQRIATVHVVRLFAPLLRTYRKTDPAAS